MLVSKDIKKAKQKALEVLIHNSKGPYNFLPRTAGWGYPEPYTRDLLISAFGILVSDDRRLLDSLRDVLKTLAKNQSPNGQIPALVHNSNERGSSDTTPLFLIALALFRSITRDRDFLQPAAEKALRWMDYQSPIDQIMVAQLPTTDWRDEHWVIGYGLFVNTLVYIFLKLFDFEKKAAKLRKLMNTKGTFILYNKPYYALWWFKQYKNGRFDLLGNSLAILSGIASQDRGKRIIEWVEKECDLLRKSGDLRINLPPVLIPYIQPGDQDWRPRYKKFNNPGEYHNGGVWPFAIGFYIGALYKVGFRELAEDKLTLLTKLIKEAKNEALEYGFNEWIRAQDGSTQGQDWQTWSAAMYLYAVKCMEEGVPIFFEHI